MTSKRAPSHSAVAKGVRTLVASVAVATVVVAAIIVWLTVREWKGTRLVWQNRLSTLATARKELIETWLSERRADMRVISGLPSVAALPRSADLVNGSAYQSAVMQVTSVLEQVAKAYGYRTLTIHRRGGQPLVRVGSEPPMDVTALAQDALNSAEFRVASMRMDQRLWLITAMPGLSNGRRSPTAQWAVTGVVDVESVFELIASEEATSRTVETLLALRDGDDVVFISPLRYGSRFERRRFDWGNLAMRFALQGEHRFDEFTDYRGIPVLGATRRVEPTGWGLVAKVDTDEAFEQFWQEAWLTAAAGLLVLFSFTGFGLSIVRRHQAKTLASELAHERALRAARERYRLLSEHAKDIILFLDSDGRLLEANHAAEKAYGWPRDQLIGRFVKDLRSPDTHDSLQEQLAQVTSEGLAFESTHQRADGSTFPVEVSWGFAELDRERLILAIVRDVTERKKHEQRIQRLQSALAAIRNVNQMLVRETDRTRLLQQTCEILQHHRAYSLAWIGIPEVEGKKIQPVAVSGPAVEYLRSATITWDDEPSGQDPTGTALRTRETCVVRSIATEPRFAPWREAALALGYTCAIAIPMQYSDKLYAALCIYTDVPEAFDDEEVSLLEEAAGDIGYALHTMDLRDESALANRRLQESERRFREMLESVDLVAVMVDTKGCVTFCNDFLLNLTGWSREEVIGQNWTDRFLPPDIRQLGHQLIGIATSSGEFPTHYENDILTRRGERRLIAWNNTVLRHPDGTIVGGTSLGADVTDRRRAEEELRRLNNELEARIRARTAELEAANKDLEAFNYSVSHDLRAPLQQMQGFVRLLEEDYRADLSPQAQHYLARVGAGSARLAQLIDALLQLARVSRAEIHPRRIDIRELVTIVFEDVRRSAGDPQVEFVIGELPTARADLTLLRQLFDVLLANAVKFSREVASPRVDVGSAMEHGEQVFFVRDNGVGFDPKYADKLFRIFQRIHTEEEFEGAGVGLSIAKRIVEKHGGRVWAEGQPGAGATFYFTLGQAE